MATCCDPWNLFLAQNDSIPCYSAPDERKWKKGKNSFVYIITVILEFINSWLQRNEKAFENCGRIVSFCYSIGVARR